jgi:hypothetical protein
VVAVVPVDDDVPAAVVEVAAGTVVVGALDGAVVVGAALAPTVALVAVLLSVVLLCLSLLHAPSHTAPTAQAMSGIRRLTMPRH